MPTFDLNRFLAQVAEILPQVHEDYLNGEGDEHERLCGLLYDLEHEVALIARDYFGQDDYEVVAPLYRQLAAHLGAGALDAWEQK